MLPLRDGGSLNAFGPRRGLNVETHALPAIQKSARARLGVHKHVPERFARDEAVATAYVKPFDHAMM
jgi:hypothetical protein